MSQEYGYSAANTIAKAKEIHAGQAGVHLMDYDFEVLEDALIAYGDRQAAAKVNAAFGLKLQLELTPDPWLFQAAVIILTSVKIDAGIALGVAAE